MLEITVNKKELLKILNGNRDRHRTVFTAALEGYRREATEILEKHIRALSAGKFPRLQIFLAVPEDHSRDYDRVISMVQMDIGTEFTLDETHFAQYVQDDWKWKREFLSTSSSYAAGTVKAVYGDQELGT